MCELERKPTALELGRISDALILGLGDGDGSGNIVDISETIHSSSISLSTICGYLLDYSCVYHSQCSSNGTMNPQQSYAVSISIAITITTVDYHDQVLKAVSICRM